MDEKIQSLYVIGWSMFTGGIDFLNPFLILKSVDIFEGCASATAIMVPEEQNGVVIITSKRRSKRVKIVKLK